MKSGWTQPSVGTVGKRRLLAPRYSMLGRTTWQRYQDCRERLEDEHGQSVPWWGELVLAMLVVPLWLLVAAIEELAPQIGQR